MILDVAQSINKVPIRLTDERWAHITATRLYLTSYYEAILDAVEQPEYILRGRGGSLVAVVALGRKSFCTSSIAK